MKTPNPDVDPFVEALRGDLPSAADEARVRARLLAAGVAVTGAALSTSSAAMPFSAATGVASGTVGAVPGGAAASGAGVSGAAVGGLGAGAAGAPAALVKAGLLSKVLLLPVAAKVGMATTLAVALAATSVPLLLQQDEAAPAADARMAQVGSTHEAVPSLPSPGPVGAPALDPAPARAGSETTSERAAAESVAPSAAAVTALSRPAATTTAPKAPRPGETRAGRAAPPRRASEPVAARSTAAEPSASVARGGSEGGRTELVRASSLGEETRLLEQAMVALGEGDHGLARRSLDEHARRFPGGLLQRERERALARLRQAEAEPPAPGSSR